MVLHFHLGRLPVTISIIKGESIERQLEELREVLTDYAMLPIQGERARIVLRRLARAAR
jgi:PII-like signaling protein